ncbi:MAG: hypothetical protein KDA89_12995 [Planctomycetaceae bacterium]|nr:hypothetical protein [Planctomycetaceae bacterium]
MTTPFDSRFVAQVVWERHHFCPPVSRMDSSPITGFITRTAAGEKYQCTGRTLQRKWSAALEVRDESVLGNLQLVTEDEKVYDGTEVTKELIEQFKLAGLNPTWYVRESWMQQEFQRKAERIVPNTAKQGSPASENDAPAESISESEPTPERTYSAEYVALLREQIEEQRRDKAALREQIAQYDETLNANTQLQQQLHILLKDMQDRLLPSPSRATTTTSSFVDAEAGSIAVEDSDKSEPAPNAERRRTSTKKSPRSKKSTHTAPGFFSLDVPTIRRVVKKISDARA